MAINGVSILTEAIARNGGIVLSLPSAGMLRHHKSRFLGEDETGFWVEAMQEDRILLDALMNDQIPVGVSFRAGPQKVSFAVPMLQRCPEFKMNAQLTLEAIQLSFPADVKAVQRRSNYRVCVPEDSELRVRLWRVPEHVIITDKPQASQELITTVRDISIGGVGVMLQGRNSEPAKVLVGERLRLALHYKEMDELVLEGRVRFLPCQGISGPARAGIQFKKLENNLEGRQTLAALTRIIGELQRAEVRRIRLGTTVA
jgi:c-di-GMP-binding flagellar brake protein YcgR